METGDGMYLHACSFGFFRSFESTTIFKAIFIHHGGTEDAPTE